MVSSNEETTDPTCEKMGDDQSSVCVCQKNDNSPEMKQELTNSNEPLNDNTGNNPIIQTAVDESITDDTPPKIPIASLIDKYENTNLGLDSEDSAKINKGDSNLEKTICINNRLYLFMHNGLFLLDFSYSKFNDKNNIYIHNIDTPHDNINKEDEMSSTETNICDDTSNRILTDDDEEDFYKIINLCQPSDIIRIIVKCEHENFEPNERNYICIIDTKTNEQGVFLGITIDSKNDLQLGLVIDYNHIELVEIVGDGCIHLNLKFEHSKSIKISPVQNFWRTLQYLPTCSDQYNTINSNVLAKDAPENNLKKSKSSIGLYSKGLNLLNTASHVNRYSVMLTKNNRITLLWHSNDYHTSELLEDTIMEIDDTRKAYNKQLTDLLVDIMTVPNAGDLTLPTIYGELSKRFHEDLKPYKCFIANETIRIYGKMERANEILPHLYLGSDFNASDINFLKSHNITHVLNATKEVNNFYVGTLTYFNVNVYDRPESNILPFFDDCYRFIETCRKKGSNILVHCHMGISRSASVVIAYLMKKYKYTYEEAYTYVKSRRSLIRPNSGFIKQLHIYDGMVHNKRVNFEDKPSLTTSNETDPRSK